MAKWESDFNLFYSRRSPIIDMERATASFIYREAYLNVQLEVQSLQRAHAIIQSSNMKTIDELKERINELENILEPRSGAV